jgi:hypothetical protein
MRGLGLNRNGIITKQIASAVIQDIGYAVIYFQNVTKFHGIRLKHDMLFTDFHEIHKCSRALYADFVQKMFNRNFVSTERSPFISLSRAWL